MAEAQHQRPAAARSSKLWVHTVKAELFGSSGSSRGHQSNTKKRGRWDPYNRFSKKEDLTKFYSGHSYRRCSLVDRERFAKFCIRKTLEDHPSDDFEETGEIMKDETIIYESGGSESIESLENVIRADGQQDVDAELPNDIATRCSKSEESEYTQKLSAAAQSIIAASPNSLGPPINPCVTYLKMTECGRYGRNNSAVWKSPFIPNLDNEDGRRGLLEHQVTAIVWLLSRMFGDLPVLKYNNRKDCPGAPYTNTETVSDFENRERLKGPKYFGGILADSMGLGKTLITAALIDLLMRQELNAIRHEDGVIQHRPILLVAPNATVANQWVRELTEVIDESILGQIIVSGPGLEESSAYDKVIPLEREQIKHWPPYLNYVWDKNNPKASKVILIMTMESWAARTCYCDGERRVWRSIFTQKKRRFSLVIVDEAHKVKNHKTKNWRSVYLLERQYTFLITATPCLNTLADLFGLARLLWTAPEDYLLGKPEIWDEIEDKFTELKDLNYLSDHPDYHDFQLVAGRPALLARMLFKPRDSRTHDIDLTRQYLKHFEKLAMLRRSPSSHIYADWKRTSPRSLEGLFPNVGNYTVDISPGEAYEQDYQRVHIDLLIRYLEGLKSWGKVVSKQGKRLKKEEEAAKVPIMNSIRLLQIASSSLDVYDLNTIVSEAGHSTLSTKVSEMREKGVNFLRLAQFLVLPTETKPETHIGWMKIATRNSPILRYILQYINENILVRKENGQIKKLLIIEHNPMLAFYYEMVLQFLGFECRCMHAQLSQEERQELIDSFNNDDNESCQILIQMYTVGFAGTNLHKSCSQVLVAAQSHSLQVQWQAIHRVIRVGQDSDVTVHRVKLKNSYHSFRESRQIEKILPELGARAHGNMKKALVKLLNLFQYEVIEAWKSPEGKRLRRWRNLLDDDISEKEDEPRGLKRIKKEEPDESPAPKRVKLDTNFMARVKGKKIKKEEDESGRLLASAELSTSNEIEQAARRRRRGNDGSGGWINYNNCPTAREAFLALRTRDEYYREFIELPQKAKSFFSHAKNNLRRLLSYGNNGGSLSTTEWVEEDLNKPPVLERALELMLRVRLGAKDIAMLPFPMIDFSLASTPHREKLQRLLAQMKHTDQDLNSATASSASRESREAMRGIDLKRPLAEIDQALEDQARLGDDSRGGWTKKVYISEVEESVRSDSPDTVSEVEESFRNDSPDTDKNEYSE
ncbi:P-loop containing nucleoside triphosphate hydrolase protein [Xylaria sp. FL0933]|nr:P-loop containing nucleoside triphosphate hydrolase protein [Xylaria sp. FL0933]